MQPSENNRVQLGRSVFLSSDESGNKKIVKLEPPVAKKNFLQKISRILFGGSLPFQNEVRINKILANQQFKFLKFPKVLNGTESQRIEFEYIEGVEYWARNVAEHTQILEALAELAKLKGVYKKPSVADFVLGNMESPVFGILRLILKARMSLRDRFLALKIVLNFILMKNLGNPLLIHNDLQCNNIMKTVEGELYLIDFEDVTIAGKLQIIDCVNVLFDSESMTINKTLLMEYWRKHANRFVTDNQHLVKYVGVQVRVCLLRRALAPCSAGHRCTSDYLVSDRLFSMVINNTKYSEWWDVQ